MKLRFPGFKILDRYILGKFLATYFFAIAMIIIVVVLFDYVEKIDDFTELHAPLRDVIFDYYLNFIPFFINQFSGLFTFIACIFFTSKMAYQTEIVAMLSGGMSFRRLMWPYFLGALIIRQPVADAQPLADPPFRSDTSSISNRSTSSASRTTSSTAIPDQKISLTSHRSYDVGGWKIGNITNLNWSTEFDYSETVNNNYIAYDVKNDVSRPRFEYNDIRYKNTSKARGPL